MQRALRLHPDSRRNAVSRIDVLLARPAPDRLDLRYVLKGQTTAIALPAPAEPLRRDGLWQHTCFELFVQRPDGYAEFNFSPSRAWAAYGFDGYRAGMRPLDGPAPVIAIHPSADEFILETAVALPGLEGAVRIGLAAVVEESDGVLSYWALDHGPGKPDFHHPAAFAWEI